MISLLGDARLHEVDDVGLGEHAALRRHVVQLRGIEGQVAHLVRRSMPTLIMHLSMVAPVPDAHLSFIDVMAVFSTRPSSPTCSRNMMILASCPPSSMTLPTSGCSTLDRQRDRVDLLHELGPEGVRQRARTRPRAVHPHVGRGGEPVPDTDHELLHHLRLAGLVTLVVLPQDLERVRITHDGLDRGGTYIDADRDPVLTGHGDSLEVSSLPPARRPQW